MRKYIVIKLSVQDAIWADLLKCKCGHRPNNHFEHGDHPCAHCECKSYRQVARYGKILSGDPALRTRKRR